MLQSRHSRGEAAGEGTTRYGGKHTAESAPRGPDHNEVRTAERAGARGTVHGGHSNTRGGDSRTVPGLFLPWPNLITCFKVRNYTSV